MLIVAWTFAKTDGDEAAGIAGKAARTESAWVRIEAAGIFLHLGEEYRQNEIRCLRAAKRLVPGKLVHP